MERTSSPTAGHEADRRLAREYVSPVIDRMEGVAGCRGVRFTRFGRDPQYDRSRTDDLRS
ncbi:hypothetical protein [Halobaculum sp. MBLA0143]|uniref:hypothetical protein n=1 Tax=Halobaculum sp. MBLA0143 TaxID=3079933 RepID=UPI00352540FA